MYRHLTRILAPWMAAAALAWAAPADVAAKDILFTMEDGNIEFRPHPRKTWCGEIAAITVVVADHDRYKPRLSHTFFQDMARRQDLSFLPALQSACPGMRRINLTLGERGHRNFENVAPLELESHEVVARVLEKAVRTSIRMEERAALQAENKERERLRRKAAERERQESFAAARARAEARAAEQQRAFEAEMARLKAENEARLARLTALSLDMTRTRGFRYVFSVDDIDVTFDPVLGADTACDTHLAYIVKTPREMPNILIEAKHIFDTFGQVLRGACNSVQTVSYRQDDGGSRLSGTSFGTAGNGFHRVARGQFHNILGRDTRHTHGFEHV